MPNNHPNRGRNQTQPKLTPKALTAIDLVTQTMATFQQELFPLIAACDTYIDGMIQLKETGDITDELAARITVAQASLSNLPTAVSSLAVLRPACDIIAGEMAKTNTQKNTTS